MILASGAMRASSANVFGSFLETVQSASERPVQAVYDVASKIASSVRASDPAGVVAAPAEQDTIPEIIRAIGRSDAEENVVSLSKATGLTIDKTAASLRDAVSTGLLESLTDAGSVHFRLTPLGRTLL